MRTLAQLAGELASGTVTSRELVERSLAAIADPAGEGERAFLSVDAEGARAAADYADGQRKAIADGLARLLADGLAGAGGS